MKLIKLILIMMCGLVPLTMGCFARGATLADFGYRGIQVNGKSSLGTRPLLIIRTDSAGDDNTTHPMSYYDDRVFNFFAYPSANGFMLVNSIGRFSFTRAGTGTIDLVRNTDFTADEFAGFADEIKKAGHSINAAARGGVDFTAYDANGDGAVTSDELVVLVVENHNVNDSGAARWANPEGRNGVDFVIQGLATRFRGQICLVSQNVSFATLCHELSHVIGAIDLYGVWNQESLSRGLTLMSATITSPDNPATYHFDPWHKLQFGWCEPRIVDMAAGGKESLPGSGSDAPDKQVILYDSRRGTDEFFMLEYRTTAAANYDENANDQGLVVWHIRQDAAHNPVQVESPYITGLTHQALWMESPPDLLRGGGKGGPAAAAGAWDSNTSTPALTWIDKSVSATTLFVRPFQSGAEAITVEIRTARDTWVDFAHAGPETGAFSTPYNTFAEGVADASYGGNLRIKAGRSRETAVALGKRMIITASGGDATLGSPQ